MEEINKKKKKRCLCNWMKTSWQKKKRSSVTGEKPNVQHWTILGLFSFLRDDTIGFQVE